MNKEAVYKQIEGRINTVQNIMLECIELIYNAGWNEAVEKAANVADKAAKYGVADDIRKLKK